MKFYTRLNQYKVQNLVFYPDIGKAVSYDWYDIAKKINGKWVINDYSYSITTLKHRSKIISLFYNLGIEIDHHIEAPRGLQNLSDAISWYEILIKNLKEEIARPRSQKLKNAKRLLKIEEHKKTIKLIKSWIKKGDV